MELLTYPKNKNAFKCLIAAEYVGVEIAVPPFTFGVDNKTPEFLKKNPFGKVPVLCLEDGRSLFESNAIARYVSHIKDVGLLGSSLEEQAKVEQWIDFSALSIDPPLSSWVIPLLTPEYLPYDKKKEKAAQETIQSNLAVLNAFLEDKTFLVNDSITLADIITACNLYPGFTNVFDDAFLEPYPHVRRYYTTLVHQPLFKKVMGEPTFCTTPLKFTPPKKSETKSAKASKEEKPKEEAEAPTDSKEKPKTWIDLLPPTPMPLDSFKRLYSNSPPRSFRETFVPRMWDGGPVPNSPIDEVFTGMDLEGYSFWYATYKYDEENTVDFMVSNKVVKDESDDMALYDLKKVDLSNAEQKKRVEDILCEDVEIEGMEISDSKVFK